ncbi:MAG TPA: TonB-dependent receptor [Gemmatimonadaceae bacterium]|nr:TonB-dependent receptor [Gemmatimonadaceae bacterium]
MSGPWKVAAILVALGVAPAAGRQLLAQTGKITGIVTDATNGQPIEGVQVRVAGTGLGALTQANGRYFIISVPPGTYTVSAQRIGFQRTEVANTTVRIDYTREINFALQPASAVLTTIRIEAEIAPLVEPGMVGSQQAIGAEIIQALPVTSVAGVLALQQGFLEIPQNTDIVSFSETRRNVQSALRIRGGRGGETLTLIDGIPVNNWAFGGAALDLSSMAVQQIDFQKGGFEPQYGNALSGIVNIATREGGTALAGNLEYQTTGLGEALGAPSGKVANNNLYQGYLSGPVPATKDRLRFLVAGQHRSGRDRVLQFDEDVFSYSNPSFPERRNQPNLGDVFTGFRGFGFDQEVQVLGKLTILPTQTSKINLTVLDYERQRQTFDFDYLLAGYNILNGGSIRTLEDSLGVLGRATPNNNYENIVQGSIRADRTLYAATFQQNFGRTTLTLRGGRFDQDRETCNVFQGVCLGSYFGDLNFTNDRFVNPGVPSGNPTAGTDEFFGGERVRTNVFRGDLESQVTDHHNLQGGVQYQRHDIRFREWRNQGTNSVLVVPQAYSAKPWDAAAYLQDRIEYDFLTARLGIRYDYGRAAGSSFTDPRDPINGTSAREVCNGLAPSIGATTPFTYTDPATNTTYTGFDACLKQPSAAGRTTSPMFDSAASVAQRDDFQEAAARRAFSPRLGLNFPLTERASLFFNAGRYTQVPVYNNLYQSTGVGTVAGAAGGNVCREDQTRPNSAECQPAIFSDGYRIAFLGNTNLLLEQTTSYEIGYATEVGRDYAINVTVFSKDQAGLSGIRRSKQVSDVAATYGTAQPTYSVIVNQDFGTSRGVELQLRRRLRNYWGYDINYSFSKATTNSPPPDLREQAENQGDPTQRNEITSEIDQPHVFNTQLFLQVGRRTPRIWMGELLRDSRLTLTMRAASGLPYTPTLSFSGIGDNGQLALNSGRGPATFQLNMLAGKDFELANVGYGVFVRVNNLTDRKNCIQVFTSTGRCDAGTVDQSRNRTGNSVGNNTTSTFFDRPEYYSERRSIFTGVRVNF